MTLQEIESLDRDYLTPADIAPPIGSSVMSIVLQVREDKKTGINSFPFPTIRIGTRVKIPRQAFLLAMRGEQE